MRQIFRKCKESKGVAKFTWGDNENEGHKQTWRVIIIGQSGSGKTLLFLNLVPAFPKPVKSISYIAPSSSHDDEVPQKLCNICKRVGIGFDLINGESTPIEIPNGEKPQIVVFDDMYKIKHAEPLIESVFVRGRHSQRHGVFITQLPAFIPSACKSNYSFCIVHRDMFSEDTEDKLRLPKGTLMQMINTNPEDSDFLVIEQGGKIMGWYKNPEYANSSNVLAVFKNLRGNTESEFKPLKPVVSEKVHQGIENAGNKNVDFEKPIVQPKSKKLSGSQLLKAEHLKKGKGISSREFGKLLLN